MQGNTRASMILGVFETEYEAMYLNARKCLGQTAARAVCLSVFQHLVEHFLSNDETEPPSRHCLTKMAQSHLVTLLQQDEMSEQTY
jgi:hypothetical protein